MSDPDALEGVALPGQQREVIGHDSIVAAITAQLDAGRLPGAIMLHGPQGIGKATLAFILARRILVATGDEDAHRVEEQVTAGAHPNVSVLRRQPRETGKGHYTEIRVGDVRALRDSLHMTRGRSGHRIAIVDSIDDCNQSAANALLKTLEEPPAETTFFLISHKPGSLLPTIRSRCHNVAMRPLADAEVAAAISLQRPDEPREQMAQAVSLAGGRPRRAFEALALSEDSPLSSLTSWFASPIGHPSAIHLALADTLAANPQSTDLSFARELLTDWLAAEARAAATAGSRMRLASANELWEKAHALFAEADALNLDMRQTLVTIFDAIRKHVQDTSPPPAEPHDR